jgi:dolichol-phosphate mannosyltransferase
MSGRAANQTARPFGLKPDVATEPAPAGEAAAVLDLSVVVPVRNEAGNIAPLLAEIQTVLDNLAGGPPDFEIIYVDDASDDATVEELAAARLRHKRLRTIRLARPGGQSAALWIGISRARGRWIATLDGDGQNDPADLPNLIEAARAGAAEASFLVVGARRVRHDGWLKRLASRIANGVRARVLGDGIKDTGCGLKLFDRRSFLDLPYFDHMHRFLPALMLAQGIAVATVAVGHRARRHGRSNYGILDRLGQGVVDLLGVLWLRRRLKRPAIERED